MSALVSKTIEGIRRAIPGKMKSAITSKVLAVLNRPEYPIELSSFSQAGEDAILRFLFKDYPLDLRDVSYLDIGARHPIFGSNTFLFYCAGARGVCVDADATFIALQREMRPRDEVLNVAVTEAGDAEGTLYFMEGGGSTLDKDEAERRAKLGAAFELKTVPLVNINTLLARHFTTPPVLLSIDIEGLDLPVLRALDHVAHPIPVICVETCSYSQNRVRAKDRAIYDVLRTKGYEAYADTYVNTIFVRSDWFHHGIDGV